MIEEKTGWFISMKELRRIPINGMLNLRDLGGYATKTGKVTLYNRFYRSELPEQYNEEMRAFFTENNLNLVVDLRNPDEIEKKACALKDAGPWAYQNISILDSVDNELLSDLVPKEFSRYPLGYIYCLGLEKAHPNLKLLAEALAEPDDGAVLFHCAYGKDRTGTLTATLLMLAGVADDDIVANYSVSADYIWPIVRPIIDKLPERFKPYHLSDAENMRMYLKAFHERFACVEDYHASLGIAPEITNKLKARLLDKSFGQG